MEGIVVGEIVVLEDQKEFICYRKIQDGGKNYLFLVSNFKPVEVFFAEEVLEGGVLCVRKIYDTDEKKRLLALFGLDLPSMKNKEAQMEPEQTRTLNGEICEESISVGESVTLENKGDFVCYRKIRYGDKEYLCLMSHAKPREFMFAEETVVEGILSVNVVTDAEKNNKLMQLVRKNPLETIKQAFKRKPKKK